MGKSEEYVFYTWIGASNGGDVRFNTGIRILSTMTFQVDAYVTTTPWAQTISCWKSGYTYSNNYVLYMEKNGTQSGRHNVAFSKKAFSMYSVPEGSKVTILYDHGVKVGSTWYGQGTTQYDMEADTTFMVRSPKLYRIMVWDNGGLICDLYPAMHVSSGECGLYDKIRGTFLHNTLSSTAVCGN